MNRIITLTLAILTAATLHAALTINECVEKACANYPAIKKYGLIASTREIDLAEIDKSWLPRVGVYGQLTVQNIVPTFPEQLTGVLQQMGTELPGISKLQYKAGVDVSQTVWDGGASKANRHLTDARSAVTEAGLGVEIYAVRRRVENTFFAILLIDEQIARNEVTLGLLKANFDRLSAMLRHGTAMQSDLDMVEAQILTLAQTIAQAKTASAGYRDVLSAFIGEPVGDTTLEIPSAELPGDLTPDRPELHLLDLQREAADASLRLADTSVMPKVGLFAQAYYGYPGFNYFQSMLNRDLSFNVLAGLKISWQVDAFYTRSTHRRRAALRKSEIEADRETFLFNNNVETRSRLASIDGLRKVIADDSRIIRLRTNVRRAAEAQLDNGIIDTTALLGKIADENVARLTARYHEIQLLQEIYELKYILNR